MWCQLSRNFWGIAQTGEFAIHSDNQAIQAVQAAVSKPKTSGFALIECEFPALAALNKLGDGSLQSAQQVDAANLAFGAKLARALSPPLIGPQATLLTSASATRQFVRSANKAYSRVHELSAGVPDISGKSQIFVLVAPSGRDYAVAKQMTEAGATVVLVNGFFKVRGWFFCSLLC